MKNWITKYSRKAYHKMRYYLVSEPQPEKWVFIAGCTNSGTSLLHKLLSFHPSIGTLPKEGQFCTNQFPMPNSTPYARLWALKPELFYLDEHNGRAIDVRKIKKHWAIMYNDVRKDILLEKSPSNTTRLRWLQKHFDNAYFIGIIRNGYAVSEGIKRKTNHPIHLCARQWVQGNNMLINDFDLLKNKHMLSYEDLVDHPEKELNKIYHFLGLEGINMDFLNNSFDILTYHSKVKNMNRESISRLSDNEISIIEDEALTTLLKYNYKANANVSGLK